MSLLNPVVAGCWFSGRRGNWKKEYTWSQIFSSFPFKPVLIQSVSASRVVFFSTSEGNLIEDGQSGLQIVENVQAFEEIAQSRTGFFIQKSGILEAYKIIDSSSVFRLALASPSLIPGSVVSQISSGDSHAMVLTQDGFVYTWGSASNGRLGLGKTCLDLQGPKLLYSMFNYRVISIACGYSHSVVVAVRRSGIENTPESDSNETDSILSILSNMRNLNDPNQPKGPRVFVWGNGMYGSLGTGDCSDMYEPVALEFFDEKNPVEISGGDYFTLVLTKDGSVYTFGSNSNGQLGIGEGAVSRSSPQLVKFEQEGIVSSQKAVKISAGSSHSLVLDSEGSVWSWGTNYHGECGHGEGSVRESLPKVSLKIKKDPEFPNFSNVSLFAGRHVSVVQVAEKKEEESRASLSQIQGIQTQLVDMSLIKNIVPDPKSLDTSSKAENISLNISYHSPALRNPQLPDPSPLTGSHSQKMTTPFKSQSLSITPDSSYIQKNRRIFAPITLRSEQEISMNFSVIEQNEKGEVSSKDEEKMSQLNSILKQTMKPETAEKITQHWLTKIFPQWSSYKYSAQLKKEIKLGVPLAIRGKLWCHLIGNNLGITPSLFSLLSAKEGEKKSKDLSILKLDLSRTFTHMEYFQGPKIKPKLSKVLSAFSVYRPDIGYVQGMNYLAAVLLLYMDEFPAFCCLTNIVCDLFMLGFYSFDENKISHRLKLFKVVMEQNLPDLVAHFEREELQPKMFAFEWILTLFSTILEINCLSYIWDFLFFYGYSFTIKLAIAVLKMNQKELLKMDIVQISNFFKTRFKKIDPLKLLRKSKKVNMPDWIRKELLHSNFSFIPN